VILAEAREQSEPAAAGAPRYLGLDETGRDMFSYPPDWVSAKFQRWTDPQVAAAGALLRSLLGDSGFSVMSRQLFSVVGLLFLLIVGAGCGWGGCRGC